MDLQEIIAIKEEVEAELLDRPGVTGVDVGDKRVGGRGTGVLAIRVHVAEKRDVPAAERIPAYIRGVPTDVLQTRFVAESGILPRLESVPGADTGRYDPLIGGISAHVCQPVYEIYKGAGTLGCMVVDAADPGSPEFGMPMLLSNAHVMGEEVGKSQAQPSPLDYESVDWLVDCEKYKVGRLSRAQPGGGLDAAVAHQTDRGFAWTIADLGLISGTAAAVNKMKVRKRGRTTGVSYGTITSVTGTYRVEFPELGRQVTLVNQIFIQPDKERSEHFAEHGDSGSVVVDDNMAVVGLLYAIDESSGSASANPIGMVAQDLKIEVPYSSPGLWIRPFDSAPEMKSSRAPSLTIMDGGQLGLAWTGTDGLVHVASTANGVVLSSHRWYDDMRSDHAPWITRGNSSTVYVAFTNADGLTAIATFPDWMHSDSHTLHGPYDSSAAGPALQVVGADEQGAQLVLLWTDTDRRLRGRSGSLSNGLTFKNQPLPDETKDGPYLTYWGGFVGYGIQGTNDRMIFRYTMHPLELDFPIRVEIANEFTVSRPASIQWTNFPDAGSEWLAWRGQESHNYLNLQSFPPSPTRKVTYPEETNAAASLIRWNNAIWIAWIDGDDRVRLAPVR